jgi:dTMP kinase
MTNKGKLITFEGGEGSGKSTQCKLLKKAFDNQNLEIIHTREPGGTEGAELIRDLLVKGDVNKWDAITETLLHLAARQDHIRNLIKPSLDSGKHIICDRFTDSTIAYQGFAHGLGLAKIDFLQKQVLGNFQPDITFILDISVKDGITRAAKRNDIENRYEKMGNFFHTKVKEGFLEIARKDPNRCILIKANDSIDNVHQIVINSINEKFSLSLESVTL